MLAFGATKIELQIFSRIIEISIKNKINNNYDNNFEILESVSVPFSYHIQFNIRTDKGSNIVQIIK